MITVILPSMINLLTSIINKFASIINTLTTITKLPLGATVFLVVEEEVFLEVMTVLINGSAAGERDCTSLIVDVCWLGIVSSDTAAFYVNEII